MANQKQTNLNFSTGEVGEIIKSQKNLVYLFKISG